MNYQNLKFLQDGFYQTQNICSWSLTKDMQLIYSNCPEQEFFFDIFTMSGCGAKIAEHFSSSAVPVIVSDRIGFVWSAVLQGACEDEQFPVIHLIGPIFTSAMTEQYLSQHIQRLHISSATSGHLWRFIREVPAISSNMACSYAAMLPCCIFVSISPPYSQWKLKSGMNHWKTQRM